MASWLDQWKSQYPYASALHGVYVPLLGWKSKHQQRRADVESIGHIRRVVAGMIGDQRYARQLGVSPRPLSPDEPLPPRFPGFLGEVASQSIHQEHVRFIAANRRPPSGGKEWTGIVDAANLPGLVKDVTARAASAERALVGLDPSLPVQNEPTSAVFTAPYLVHEAAVGGVLQYLASHAPGALAAALRPSPLLPMEHAAWVDPLASFDPERQAAFLSPIGPMDLYRQYFFELDTLLGPPIGHVWISPASTLEVYEVHTLRSIQTRETEQSTMSDTRTETSLNTSDDLASSVTNQTAQNMAVGVSVSAGVNMGVWQASTSSNFNNASSKNVSDQETHKATRAQTQKAASEVRQNFKTTFKTTLDQTDTVSRRFVLQNSTTSTVNYELRRKMRRIAVQLQHIGTRLCWQIYIDDPGRHLGVAELVHVAKPYDNSQSQPPAAPAVLMPREVTMTVAIPFSGFLRDGALNDDRDEDYVSGYDYDGLQIKWNFSFTGIPPATGYTLKKQNGISLVSHKGVDNPSSTNTVLLPRFSVLHDGVTFEVTLDHVNFDNNHELSAQLLLVWEPPNQSAQIAAWHQAMDAYTNQQALEQHAAYVQSVRDRLDAVSAVKKRPADDLREEERVAVFRALMKHLIPLGEPHDWHTTSELLRSVFDLDSMLYFVAPDYWKPQRAQRQQVDQESHKPANRKAKLNLEPSRSAAHHGSASIKEAVDASDAASAGAAAHHKGSAQGVVDGRGADSLNAHDLIAWGGRLAHDRDNYLVTEHTDPAPYGASLGWMIALDGDQRRNAFLNSPWVKAVIPIQPGHELAAISWLSRDHVEGTDGWSDPPIDGSAPTVKDALLRFAKEIATANTDPKNIGQAEQVYEQGFNPLDGGIQLNQAAYQPFDQWVEIMPTDQVVAIDYKIPPVGPPSAQVPDPVPPVGTPPVKK